MIRSMRRAAPRRCPARLHLQYSPFFSNHSIYAVHFHTLNSLYHYLTWLLSPPQRWLRLNRMSCSSCYPGTLRLPAKLNIWGPCQVKPDRRSFLMRGGLTLISYYYRESPPSRMTSGSGSFSAHIPTIQKKNPYRALKLYRDSI